MFRHRQGDPDSFRQLNDVQHAQIFDTEEKTNELYLSRICLSIKLEILEPYICGNLFKLHFFKKRAKMTRKLNSV